MEILKKLVLGISFWLMILGMGILPAQSRALSGTIFDEEGNTLPYATIFVAGTSTGTTSNGQGKYSLQVPEGQIVLHVKYIGFAQLAETLEVSRPLKKDFVLKREDVAMEEVVITDDGKDPAYAIIRKAIERKKENRAPLEAYTCEAYTKTVFRTSVENDSTQTASPIPGLLGIQTPDSSNYTDGEEIVYLAENISKIWHLEPGRHKEEIISSQVSGNPGGYSLIGNVIAQTLDYSPYDNRTELEGITARGIMSPIANSAMLFYDYKLMGTVQTWGKKAYKIKVIPKRPTDPVFSGTIYVLDSLYAVESLDLFITGANQLNGLDTLRIRQQFSPDRADSWLPFSRDYQFKVGLNILGVKIGLNGASGIVTTKYVHQPDLKPSFFDAEELVVGDSAVNRDSAYWEANRPVPLPVEEANDYQEKDSLRRVQESPEYLDSLTKARNEFKPVGFLLFGYNYRNYRKKVSWEIDPPLETISFNPMEGWHGGVSVERRQDWESRRQLKVGGALRYGTSNGILSWRTHFEFRGKAVSRPKFRVEAGDYPREFSSFSQLPTFLNFLYCAFARESHLKLYQARFANVEWEQKVANGLKLQAGARWEDRKPLRNTSEWGWVLKDSAYAENIALDRHQAIVFRVRAEWKPGNKYAATPDGRVDLGSAWPTLSAEYQQSFYGFLGSDLDYSRLEIGLRDAWDLGLVGDLALDLSAGTFLQADSLQLPDAKHVRANQTLVRRPVVAQFGLPDYYQLNSTTSWVEAHGEQAFKGFFLNKIPLIRRLRLREYAGAHLWLVPGETPYAEFNIGLEKRIVKQLIPIRVDYHQKISGNAPRSWYFTFTWILNEGVLQIGD